MLEELRAAYPDSDIRILGVNEAGYESGNSRLAAAASIPALQDTFSENVTDAWAVTYRDVVLVDENGTEGRSIQSDPIFARVVFSITRPSNQSSRRSYQRARNHRPGEFVISLEANLVDN